MSLGAGPPSRGVLADPAEVGELAEERGDGHGLRRGI